jgi:hypothetical protein
VVGPAKWEPSSQELSAAYWTLEPGWNTDVEMRNNLTSRELTVTPVLRASSGQEISLAPVTVAAKHVISLDLRSLAQSQPQILNGTGLFGSVAFRFGGLNSSNLFAATIVRREGQPIDFHFDADEAGSPIYTTGGLEGMWWVPAQTSTDYLILSNRSKKTVAGNLILSLTSANRRLPVSIGPGQTTRIDLRETLGPSSVGVMGGLTLSLPGHESLSATQIVFDEATGLAAIMKLFDRELDEQSGNHVLLAPMMALSQPDPGLGFPNGTTLIPRLFLRNAGPGQAQVSLTVDWRSASKSGESAFPTFTLPPGEMTTINLADPQTSVQVPSDAMWGTVRLGYAGRSAELVLIALSYDQNHRYGLQTPFSENVSRLWAGGMWHVDPTHNTLITTGNVGPESTAAQVTLFYNGGKSKYRLERMLSPGQQLWVDVGELIRDQVADSDGHTLPADTMTGSYELRDLDHATVGHLYEGKLVIDKTYGHASYGCGSCCGYDAVVFAPFTFDGPPDIDNEDFIHANDTCTGDVDDVTGSAYGWGSTDTTVATLPNSTLHTVAVGTATGNAAVQLEWAHPPKCPTQTFPPQQSVTVTPQITSVKQVYGAAGFVPMRNSTVNDGANYISYTATCNPSNGDFAWTTSSSNVTLQNTTGPTVTVYSAKASTNLNDTSIQVTCSLNGKTSAASTQTLTVQQPTKLLKTGTDQTSAETTCTVQGGGAGCGLPYQSKGTGGRTFTYQVQDQLTPPDPINAQLDIFDGITTVSNGCSLTSYQTTCPSNSSCGLETGSGGTFPEQLTICASACVSSSKCVSSCAGGPTAANQTWTVNGYPLTGDVKALTYNCTSVLVNGQ